MSSNINNSYKPGTGFILLTIVFLCSSGIVYWSFLPNNIERLMKLNDRAYSHVLKKEYKESLPLYSQAAQLHYEPFIKAQFFMAAANSANRSGNIKEAKRNLYLCYVNYALFNDSYNLLIKLIPQIKSDIDVVNFINKIHTIDNFPLIELIKAANYRIALIKNDDNKKQFEKLLVQQVRDGLESGPKPVFNQ